MFAAHPTEVHFYLKKGVNPENRFVQLQHIATYNEQKLKGRGTFSSSLISPTPHFLDEEKMRRSRTYF